MITLAHLWAFRTLLAMSRGLEWLACKAAPPTGTRDPETGGIWIKQPNGNVGVYTRRR